jgi:hypothetical protein
MSISLSSAAGLLAGLSLLIGCGGGGAERPDSPTAPVGVLIPDVRGVYSAPDFWTFEALRLADGTMITWSCGGRVTILRQSGTDILGTFLSMPADGESCEPTTGDITSGIVGDNGRVFFETDISGQDPSEFFALPGCVLVTQDSLWRGSAGDRLIASRRLTVDCPADGRLEITGRAAGPRTSRYASGSN